MLPGPDELDIRTREAIRELHEKSLLPVDTDDVGDYVDDLWERREWELEKKYNDQRKGE